MRKIRINEAWEFWKDGQEENKQTVNLPHDAMQLEKRVPELENGAGSGYYPGGKYWYRKTFFGSEEFCERLLYGQRVATVPGTAFGSLGEGHIRCSAASSNENIQKALDRIRAFMDTL